MTQSVKDLINAISEGDASTIDAAFNSAMAEKISARMEDMRVQVAQNMFKSPVAEETEEVAEEQVEEAVEETVEESTEEVEESSTEAAE